MWKSWHALVAVVIEFHRPYAYIFLVSLHLFTVLCVWSLHECNKKSALSYFLRVTCTTVLHGGIAQRRCCLALLPYMLHMEEVHAPRNSKQFCLPDPLHKPTPYHWPWGPNQLGNISLHRFWYSKNTWKKSKWWHSWLEVSSPARACSHHRRSSSRSVSRAKTNEQHYARPEAHHFLLSAGFAFVGANIWKRWWMEHKRADCFKPTLLKNMLRSYTFWSHLRVLNSCLQKGLPVLDQAAPSLGKDYISTLVALVTPCTPPSLLPSSESHLWDQLQPKVFLVVGSQPGRPPSSSLCAGFFHASARDHPTLRLGKQSARCLSDVSTLFDNLPNSAKKRSSA